VYPKEGKEGNDEKGEPARQRENWKQTGSKMAWQRMKSKGGSREAKLNDLDLLQDCHHSQELSVCGRRSALKEMIEKRKVASLITRVRLHVPHSWQQADEKEWKWKEGQQTHWILMTGPGQWQKGKARSTEKGDFLTTNHGQPMRRAVPGMHHLRT